ncbi:MAG TPA: GTPase HflX [Bdellovibrionales bacterium]|nr:GTPase HflX [Bdellovibrionales bacterium]
MLDQYETLLPGKSSAKKLRVVTVGSDEESLNELDRLLNTLGVEPVGRVIATVRKINASTYFGKGKIDEARMKVECLKADALIVDVELSPNQLRNIEAEIKKAILDRPGVIIEIFSEHARTRESKTQVALARLQYLLPRLSHFWTHFERQRGGGTAARGMGEKRIEVDRRMVKKQMTVLRDRLKLIEKERNVQRSGRKDVLKVAIVGYTNAGKSTLLNSMTHSDVLVEDKLFATLDASVRALDPNSHPPIVAIDTVGFISRLPPTLVASFRSTLEELQQADLLLHVVDASSSQAREQYDETERILKELKVEDKPRLVVLNKADLLGTQPGARNRARLVVPGAMMVSALNPEDVEKVRETVMNHFRGKMEVWEVLIPYSESKLESQLHAHGSIEVSRYMTKGTFYRLRMDEGWARKLQLKKFQL